MKKAIFTFAITIFFVFEIYSQEFINVNSSYESTPTKISTINDTLYFLCCYRIADQFFQPVIYRYTMQGEKIDSLCLIRSESSVFYSIIEVGNSLKIFGRKKNIISGEDDIEMITLNKQLQIVADTLINENYGSISRLFTLVQNDNIIIYGDYNLGTNYYGYLIKINNVGNILNEKRYLNNNYFFFSLVPLNNSYYAYFMTNNYISLGYGSSIILKLDSSFELINIYEDPYLSDMQDAFTFNDHLYVSGKRLPQGSSGEISYSFVKLDTNCILIDSIDFGDINTKNSPGAFKSNSGIVKNIIYVGGTNNICFATWYPYSTETSQIQLSRVDTNLNTIWDKHYYNENIYYELWSMDASKTNGSCLLVCRKYNISDGKKDIVVFKVDSNGTAYSIIGEMPEETGISVYPNPATDFVTIESNDISKNPLISIYNLQGKLVNQFPLTETRKNIDISAYAKGLYLIKVSNNSNTKTFKILKN